MSTRARLNDLLAQRSQHLTAAQNALDSGDHSTYQTELAAATGMNSQIEDLQGLLAEQDRYARDNAIVIGGTGRENLEEMGAALQAGQAVRLNVAELMQAAGLGRQNSTTVATTTLVSPQGGGSTIRPNLEVVSGLVDQVSTIDLTGFSGYEEPYEVSGLTAQGGKPATTAGTERTASDPTFAKAKISPYELTVTSYVDRNLSRLSPVAYASKIQSMALRAMRRKLAGLIVNSDGQSTPVMYGITNAKNTDGAAIFASKALGTAINETTLWELISAYGGTDSLGGTARLLLSKANLRAFGNIRGTNEKARLYKIQPDAGNSTTGTIVDGGLIVPYTLISEIGDNKLAYGSPADYLMGLFGDTTIRVDESYKAGSRLNTILGDAMVGGNLVVHNGFVLGTLSSGS